MSWFDKKRSIEQELIAAKIESEAPKIPEPKVEEWIWINGFKGTKQDMTCNGYQYELLKSHDIPDDQEVIECQNGFHLCMNLHDVFDYYDVVSNHRFFEVKALVRKTDLKNYTPRYGHNKLVAKSIIFVRELDADEILRTRIVNVRPYEKEILDFDSWADEYKQKALEIGMDGMFNTIRIDKLEALGYSRPFASHILSLDVYDAALSIGSQTDLSMDIKCMYIYEAVQREYRRQEEYRSSRSSCRPSYRYSF